MPQIFKIGAYLVFIWINEGNPVMLVCIRVATLFKIQVRIFCFCKCPESALQINNLENNRFRIPELF